MVFPYRQYNTRFPVKQAVCISKNTTYFLAIILFRFPLLPHPIAFLLQPLFLLLYCLMLVFVVLFRKYSPNLLSFTNYIHFQFKKKIEEYQLICYNSYVVQPTPSNGRRCSNGNHHYFSSDCHSRCGLPPHQQMARQA